MMRVLRPGEEDPNDPDRHLKEFSVAWKSIKQEDVDSLRSTLDSASNEREMQEYLEKYPIFLVQYLRGGHGRWVIPHKRLGSEHVTDFIIGECSSIGCEWVAVELESPTETLFKINGDLKTIVNHAIRQITDWRVWLQNNIGYASQPRDKGGLGLTDINGNLPGLIIIGRRASLDPSTKERRRRMSQDLNIQIHTYDWLIESAKPSK